jgi:alkylation response protein AidB-like acyl-CoA dehydrogenase
MIDFELDDELTLIQETAREFASDHLRPGLRDHESARAVPPEIRKAFQEIGFQGLECPESVGGSALGALARCVVMQELGAADPGAALALDSLGPALYPLLEIGGPDAVQRFAQPVLDRDGGRAVLVWNGAGTRARLEFSAESVSGSVPWVPAERVDLLVLLDEQGCYVIETGVQCEKLRGGGLRAAGASALTLEAAPIAAHFEGAQQASTALARARLYVTALLVGVMRESSDFARAYALDRVAFGKPIAHHQGLAFLLTDMAMAVEGSHVMLLEAAARFDDPLAVETASPLEANEAAATAFAEACEQAMFVTPNGVQVLGGHGFMQDYPVEKMMREARALSLLVGGVDLAREEAGQELCARQGIVQLTLEVTP